MADQQQQSSIGLILSNTMRPQERSDLTLRLLGGLDTETRSALHGSASFGVMMGRTTLATQRTHAQAVLFALFESERDDTLSVTHPVLRIFQRGIISATQPPASISAISPIPVAPAAAATPTRTPLPVSTAAHQNLSSVPAAHRHQSPTAIAPPPVARQSLPEIPATQAPAAILAVPRIQERAKIYITRSSSSSTTAGLARTPQGDAQLNQPMPAFEAQDTRGIKRFRDTLEPASNYFSFN